MKYKVYGDYGFRHQRELYESDNFQEARAWADNYVRWGDFGGYSAIEVIRDNGDQTGTVVYSLEDLGVEDDYCFDDGA